MHLIYIQQNYKITFSNLLQFGTNLYIHFTWNTIMTYLYISLLYIYVYICIIINL